MEKVRIPLEKYLNDNFGNYHKVIINDDIITVDMIDYFSKLYDLLSSTRKDYKKEFIDMIAKQLSKVIKLDHGIGVIFDIHKVMIIPKKELFFDGLPQELTTVICTYLSFDDVDIIINLSINPRKNLWNDIIKEVDNQYTGGKLWKWIKSIEGYEHNIQDCKELMKFYEELDNNMIKYDFDIVKSKLVRRGKSSIKLIDFLLDTTTDFTNDIGYPFIYTNIWINLNTKYIWDDKTKFCSSIKMRQFYPHFLDLTKGNWISIQYEKEFSANLYYIIPLLNNIEGVWKETLIKYINTGEISNIPDYYFDTPQLLSGDCTTSYFLCNMLIYILFNKKKWNINHIFNFMVYINGNVPELTFIYRRLLSKDDINYINSMIRSLIITGISGIFETKYIDLLINLNANELDLLLNRDKEVLRIREANYIIKL